MSTIPDTNPRIAGRVRGLRATAGLSLEALAGRCDVSRSMLSRVDRGEANPTAVVLEKIVTGLRVSLGSLFDDASAPHGPVSPAADRVRWKGPKSGYVRRNISPANFPSPIRIVEVQFLAARRWRIPKYALLPDGPFIASVFFYKDLAGVAP